MYSCAGNEYSYQLSTLFLITTYFHSGRTFGKGLKNGKRKCTCATECQGFNIFRKEN
jgi:hypothetical protein